MENNDRDSVQSQLLIARNRAKKKMKVSSALNPFALDNNEKFSCIALQVPFVEIDLPKRLNPYVTVFGEIQRGSLGNWEQSIGSLMIDQLCRSNFIICAHENSCKPEILDVEHTKLMRVAGNVLTAMLLSDIALSSKPTHLQGSHIEGSTSIRSISYSEAVLRSGKHPFTVLGDSRFEQISKLLARFSQILSRPNEFTRLRRGIDSVVQALQARIVDERIFYFVRALEAVFAGGKQFGERAFVTRCQLFTGNDVLVGKLLTHMYKTRNNYVHANEFDELLIDQEDLDQMNERLMSMAVDAQLLILQLFNEILLDDATVENFSSQSKASAFWDKPSLPIISTEQIRQNRANELASIQK